MIDENIKKTYFAQTFNQQMAWIGEEVEHIIRYEKNENFKNGYRNSEYCNSINRLFEIIKADQKNIAVVREIDRAEKEWNDFVNDEPESFSEGAVLKYWKDYMWAYVAELKSQPIRYFLMRGYSVCHDGDGWIGIYDSIGKLQEEYLKAVDVLEKEHVEYGVDGGRTYAGEKVMIHTFNEVTKQWRFEVSADTIFVRGLKFNEQ